MAKLRKVDLTRELAPPVEKAEFVVEFKKFYGDPCPSTRNVIAQTIFDAVRSAYEFMGAYEVVLIKKIRGGVWA